MPSLGGQRVGNGPGMAEAKAYEHLKRYWRVRQWSGNGAAMQGIATGYLRPPEIASSQQDPTPQGVTDRRPVHRASGIETSPEPVNVQRRPKRRLTNRSGYTVALI